MRKRTCITALVAVVMTWSLHATPASADSIFETPKMLEIDRIDPNTATFVDFDGDGDDDIVTYDREKENLLLILQMNNGTFRTAASQPINVLCKQFTVADFDGDGNSDIAITEVNGTAIQRVSFLFYNGQGTFSSPVTVNVPSAGIIASADMDNDGDMDVLTAGSLSTNLTFLENNGDGTFAAPVSIPAGCTPAALELCDLNGDGTVDITMPLPPTGEVAVILNNPSGTFSSSSVYPICAAFSSLDLIDLDDDGDMDFAVLYKAAQSVITLLNQGDATFTAGTTSSIDPIPTSLTWGDMDNDGDIDLAAAHNSDSSVVEGGIVIYTNQGTGEFVRQVEEYVTLCRDSVINSSDFDNDGNIDIAALGSVANLLFDSRMSILTNTGEGRFATGTKARTHINVRNNATGDFDLDGAVEIVTADASNACLYITKVGAERQVAPLLSWVVTPQFAPSAVSVCDMNFDSKPDLVTLSSAGRAIEVLLNQGDGTFAQAAWTSVYPSESSQILLGDLDGDKDIDVIVANSSTLDVHFNQGDHTFVQGESYSGSSDASELQLGDLDGDGDLDLAYPCCLDEICIRFNAGDGTFADSTHLVPESGLSIDTLVVCDVDNDDLNDIVFTSQGGNHALSVMHNNGGGAFEETVHQYAPFSLLRNGMHCALWKAMPADFDCDGDVDFAMFDLSNSFVLVMLNNGHGVFTASKPYPTSQSPWLVIPGDFDGDNRPDLAVLHSRSVETLFLWNRYEPTLDSPRGLTAFCSSQGLPLYQSVLPIRATLLGSLGPIACRQIECVRLSGEFSLTSGTTVNGDEDRRRIITNTDGEAIIAVKANALGVGLFGFVVPGTNIPMAYCVVDFTRPQGADSELQPQIGTNTNGALKPTKKTRPAGGGIPAAKSTGRMTTLR